MSQLFLINSIGWIYDFNIKLPNKMLDDNSYSCKN
jgi:hypothetical protein